jgi:oligopeptide/dipeptide ABC transporter ATP-binding protein
MNSHRNDPPKPGSLLEVRRLCKEFPSGGLWGKETIRAIENVDMEVNPGEIRGIVGESGSGKTTLARCSLRLLEPSSGSIFFDGKNLASLSAAALREKRREFQMVFQDPYASLNPSMNVEEIILEPMIIHRLGDRQSRLRYVRELLSAVSLSESLLKRKPAELSGGQQQRVGIARGLALKPRLLVADEPVSSLDASVQVQILNLLADIAKHYKLTLILISHSLYAIHYLCSRISVMYRGRIVEESSAEIFFESPNHPYSRLLLESMPTADSSGRNSGHSSAGNSWFSSIASSGCAFHPHCSQARELCRERVPHLKELRPGLKVACFLFF